MAKVCVWPHRHVEGWAGDPFNTTAEYPVVDLATALKTVYNTHAHFTCGVASDAQPRFRKWGDDGKSTDETFAKLGINIRFETIAADIDRPAEASSPDEWWENQLFLLGHAPIFKTAGWYRTRGGYRLVWELARPVSHTEWEVLTRKLIATLAHVGIKQDRLIDWTRCYGLPFVVRDGEPQNYPYDFSKMGVLDEAALLSVPDDVIGAIASAPIADAWAFDPANGRNSGLFRLAVNTLRGLPDIPDEYLEILVRGIHDSMCPDPLPEAELRTVINNARRYRPASTVDIGTSSGVALRPREPVYVRPGEKVAALDRTIDILASNKGCLYNRGGGLMRLRRDIEDQLIFEDIPLPTLRMVIERMVAYQGRTKDGDSPIDAPGDIVAMLASMADYGDAVWKLQEILTTPSLRPDGRPVTRPGYHEDLQIYLDCPEDMSNLDLTGDPHAAFARVRHLLVDIPFAEDVHESVAMSSFITPVVRTAINGPVPLVMFDSTTRGSGKTLLADLTSILATGRKSTIQPYVDETEFEKRVTALLESGARVVTIDNIDRPFGGPTLDALLTSTIWTGRVLGQTKMIKLRARSHWMATGNNITIQGDLDRRALRCYLSPNMEQPETRPLDKYAYPDIENHVLTNRAAYVRDILTFVKAYIDLGCPGNLPAMGSFTDWSRVVRGCLVHYGMADPVESQAALRRDSATGSWETFLIAAESIWGERPFTARDVYEEGFMPGSGVGSPTAKHAIQTVMEDILGATKPNPKAIGSVLKKWSDRVVGNKKVHPLADRRDRIRGNMYCIKGV